jgi:hypothetical protein
MGIVGKWLRGEEQTNTQNSNLSSRIFQHLEFIRM